MGNIRATYIKRVAFHLLKTYPQLFSQDFDHNKVMVGRVTDVRHKAMRNRIAGYVTTLKKRKPIA
jgi:small subunit ribosomal protein S17e